jgi:endonuclease YncB( thermonuclease family)
MVRATSRQKAKAVASAVAGIGSQLSLLALLLTPPGVAAVEGRATIIDGDSLVVGETEVRLHGIDAPEGRQNCEVKGQQWRCGQAAAETLQMLTVRKIIVCAEHERDRYERVVATCHRDDLNINATMVEVGMALAYRHHSTRYVAEEEVARQQRRGVWDSNFVPPWEWRAQQRTADAHCVVKGNVNRHGARIYHTRQSPHYAQVKIHHAEGDRCFETTAAAEAAGFRAPKMR